MKTLYDQEFYCTSDYYKYLLENSEDYVAFLNDSYKSGFDTGTKWNSPWIPGGPFVHQVRAYEKKDALSIVSKAQNESWMRGWHDAGGSAKAEASRVSRMAAGLRVPY